MTRRDDYRELWKNVPPQSEPNTRIPEGASLEADKPGKLPQDMTDEHINALLKQDQ